MAIRKGHKSNQYFYSRAGIKPKKYSNDEFLKFHVDHTILKWKCLSIYILCKDGLKSSYDDVIYAVDQFF